MSDPEQSMWEELDALPPAPRPSLTFVTVIIAASEAARAGLDKVAEGKHEQAAAAVEACIRDMRPVANMDSQDAWARKGAVSGVATAWATKSGMVPQYHQPHPCPSSEHATAHFAAWQLAASTVMGVRYE